MPLVHRADGVGCAGVGVVGADACVFFVVGSVGSGVVVGCFQGLSCF